MFEGHTQTAKVDAAEFEQLIRFFMRLELVAHSPEEFDVDDHFNKKDPDYEFMIAFMKDGQFNYRAFIKASVGAIGTGFARVMNGYGELVDKYCDPDSLVLEPIKAEYEKQLDLYFKTIQDNVEYKFQEFYKNCPVKIALVRFQICLDHWATLRPGQIEFYNGRFEDQSCQAFKINVPAIPGFNTQA